MNGFERSKIVGIGIALSAVVGVSALVPGVARRADYAVEYIHIDYAKKKLICEPKQEANSTALIEQWHMRDKGMKYWTNTASIPAYLDPGQVLSAIDLAAQAWRDAGVSDLSSDGQTDSAGSITDGKNTISFGVLSVDAVSAATMRIKDGIVVEADIVLDAASLWATNPTSIGGCNGAAGRFDVQNVLTHEFGHWVGAAHPTNGDNGNKWRTMWSDIAPGELWKRTLTAGDKNSIPSQSGALSSFSGTVVRAGDDDG